MKFEIVLRIVRGNESTVKSFTRGHREKVVIGRAGEDLSLMDPFLSRFHLGLAVYNKTLIARDLNSRHGTRLNKKKMEGRSQVRVGDVFDLGNIQIEVLGFNGVSKRAKAPAKVVKESKTSKKSRRGAILWPLDLIRFYVSALSPRMFWKRWVSGEASAALSTIRSMEFSIIGFGLMWALGLSAETYFSAVGIPALLTWVAAILGGVICPWFASNSRFSTWLEFCVAAQGLSVPLLVLDNGVIGGSAAIGIAASVFWGIHVLYGLCSRFELRWNRIGYLAGGLSIFVAMILMGDFKIPETGASRQKVPAYYEAGMPTSLYMQQLKEMEKEFRR